MSINWPEIARIDCLEQEKIVHKNKLLKKELSALKIKMKRLDERNKKAHETIKELQKKVKHYETIIGTLN